MLPEQPIFANNSESDVHDRDTKFCASFRSMLLGASVQPLKLPPRSSNLNAFPQGWVLSAKQEYLSKTILFGERSLKRVLAEFIEHYHLERNHQGKGNVLLFPPQTNQPQRADDTLHCNRRLGGLLRYYSRAA
jgi:putative transposase